MNGLISGWASGRGGETYIYKLQFRLSARRVREHACSRTVREHVCLPAGSPHTIVREQWCSRTVRVRLFTMKMTRTWDHVTISSRSATVISPRSAWSNEGLHLLQGLSQVASNGSMNTAVIRPCSTIALCSSARRSHQSKRESLQARRGLKEMK